MARAIDLNSSLNWRTALARKKADAILSERGVEVIPDIYSSGGGVRVSAAEKIQGLENQKWTEVRVAEWLRSRMFQAFKDLDAVREKNTI